MPFVRGESSNVKKATFRDFRVTDGRQQITVFNKDSSDQLRAKDLFRHKHLLAFHQMQQDLMCRRHSNFHVETDDSYHGAANVTAFSKFCMNTVTCYFNHIYLYN